MLYWICPECGHECSPAIRECPTCTAAEKAAPTSQDILSLAQTFQSAPVAGPPAELLSAAPRRNLSSAANGYSVPASAAVITAEVATATEEVPAPAGAVYDGTIDSLVKAPLPAGSEPVKPKLSPLLPGLTAPAVVAATSSQSEFGLKLAGPAPTGDVNFQAAFLRLPKAQEQSAEPAPSRRRSVAFVREALPGVSTSELALADLTQPGELRLTPAVPATNGQSDCGDETSALPLDPKAGSLAFGSSNLELAGESLPELLHALQASAEELERAAIEAIHASFQDRPTELLLCAAREIVTAPAPPAEQWLRSPRIVFIPQAPGSAAPATLTAGPQPPTLAGPCLPPQLLNFTESRNSRQRLSRKSAGAPTWMVSVLVAIAIFLGGGSLLQYLTANRDAKAATAAPAPAELIERAPAPALPVAEEHPGARFVEVAGIRVVTTPNRKPQLQYIVINHSASELTGLNIHIAVHSADSPAGAPLFRVSSIVPSLGANQSKEIRTDLDAGLSAAAIPDWQSLRPEILIAHQ
jgi:hypothetical protein